jgi:hypothetical protein
MSFRIIAVLVLLSLSLPVFADEETTTQPEKKSPGLFHRMTNIFHKDAPADGQKVVKPAKKGKGLDLALNISPDPLKLSESHQLQVSVTLTNNTGKMVQLNFPTTQRIEVLMRNQAGKVVTQWSEDQSFVNDAGYVTINPRENVQYTANISGRDLVAGQPYTIEVFFPNYENLKISATVVPQR